MVYELAKYIPSGYHYYDTPDGQDCLLKAWYSAKIGALMGTVIGSYDVLLYSHTVGLRATMFRYAYWIGPLALMGVTYSVATCISINLRREDDIWNHGIGGLLSGTVWGASRKSGFGGFGASAVAAVVLMLIKDSYLDDYELFPTKVQKRWSPFMVDPKYDYTISGENIIDPITYNEGFKNTQWWGG